MTLFRGSMALTWWAVQKMVSGALMWSCKLWAIDANTLMSFEIFVHITDPFIAFMDVFFFRLQCLPRFWPGQHSEEPRGSDKKCRTSQTPLLRLRIREIFWVPGKWTKWPQKSCSSLQRRWNHVSVLVLEITHDWLSGSVQRSWWVRLYVKGRAMIYFFPRRYVDARKDRVTVIFSTVFKDDDDIIIGKVFMQVRPITKSKSGNNLNHNIQVSVGFQALRFPRRVQLCVFFVCLLVRSLKKVADGISKRLRFFSVTRSRHWSWKIQMLELERTLATSRLVRLLLFVLERWSLEEIVLSFRQSLHLIVYL